ncbi:hypothetical protein [Halegenticoccus tardaugens]|uniref:hypothetical protein n=1 Tax=Halegenticoccus tardaugens TaxID=2071624 RepID=UPI00100BD716|nr:hypothetical protein [Halegenticoccus tardaugens]
MIVVATEDFELYHDVVAELRDRGVAFTTIRPGDDLPEGTRVLITAPTDESSAFLGGNDDERAGDGERDHGRASENADGRTDDAGNAEAGAIAPEVERVVASADETRRAVEEALAILRGGGRTVVGVDPGVRPGIAVLVGDVVVSAFHVPLGDAVDVITREVADAVDPVVRVGDGARLQGAQIVNDLDDVTVELVDETGTTPYLGTGARGMGDVLAAVNIARIEGERVDSREIEPTAGELQRIKDRSRRESGDNRTIDESLARRVAAGELTIDEALDEHRGFGSDGNDGDGGSDEGEGDDGDDADR